MSREKKKGLIFGKKELAKFVKMQKRDKKGGQKEDTALGKTKK